MLLGITNRLWHVLQTCTSCSILQSSCTMLADSAALSAKRTMAAVVVDQVASSHPERGFLAGPNAEQPAISSPKPAVDTDDQWWACTQHGSVRAINTIRSLVSAGQAVLAPADMAPKGCAASEPTSVPAISSQHSGTRSAHRQPVVGIHTVSRREVSPVLVDSPLMRHAQISTAARSGPVSLSLCS